MIISWVGKGVLKCLIVAKIAYCMITGIISYFILLSFPSQLHTKEDKVYFLE